MRLGNKERKMYIYILCSELFKGQSKKVITSFSVSKEAVEKIANQDNNYPENAKWIVVETR